MLDSIFVHSKDDVLTGREVCLRGTLVDVGIQGCAIIWGTFLEKGGIIRISFQNMSKIIFTI